MARCPVELLDDVGDVIAEVRSWQGVVEKKPAVLYLQRQPFLHFHLIEGVRRRADIKAGAGWIQVELPQPLSATRRRAFVRELRRRYREKFRAGTAPRRR
jgi:hypothetical protein